MKNTSEGIGWQEPGERATAAETWPLALRELLRAAAKQSIGPDKVRCATCHNLTGCLDLWIVGNGLVACGRCASHVETRTGPGWIVELIGE